jgi:hypothetical protein
MADQIEKLRLAAQEQAQLLKRQRDGLDRKIAEIEGFLKVLDDVAGRVSAGESGLSARPTAYNGAGTPTENSMPGRIATILREHGKPMRAGEIARILESQGLQYEGKHPLKIIVSTELARQSKKHAHGIRKVGTGRYTAA